MTGPRPLIAVVDDEASIRKALTRLLRAAGMEVQAFPSGVEFLAACSALMPDCVVLDLHMPVLDGFQIQQKLSYFRHPPPVVVITGHDSDEAYAQALAGKPVAYLRKPMSDEALLNAITTALKAGGETR